MSFRLKGLRIRTSLIYVFRFARLALILFLDAFHLNFVLMVPRGADDKSQVEAYMGGRSSSFQSLRIRNNFYTLI